MLHIYFKKENKNGKDLIRIMVSKVSNVFFRSGKFSVRDDSIVILILFHEYFLDKMRVALIAWSIWVALFLQKTSNLYDNN